MDESVSSTSSQLLQLAERAAKGDESAFAELFKEFRPHLRQFIDLRLDQRVRRRVDPSDVLQNTQLEVFMRLGEFLERRPMPLRVWLRRTALQHVIRAHEKHLKAERRTVAREARLSHRSSITLAKRFVGAEPRPSQAALQKERIELVAEAISRLNDADRDILVLRNVEGLDFGEIAFSLDITSAAARKRFGRALLRLHKQLRELGLGDLLE